MGFGDLLRQGKEALKKQIDESNDPDKVTEKNTERAQKVVDSANKKVERSQKLDGFLRKARETAADLVDKAAPLADKIDQEASKLAKKSPTDLGAALEKAKDLTGNAAEKAKELSEQALAKGKEALEGSKDVPAKAGKTVKDAADGAGGIAKKAVDGAGKLAKTGADAVTSGAAEKVREAKEANAKKPTTGSSLLDSLLPIAPTENTLSRTERAELAKKKQQQNQNKP